MITSRHKLKQIFQNTALANREILEIPVPDTGEIAFALDIPVNITGDELESTWRIARNLLSQTGRWPIVSTAWSNQSNIFSEFVKEADFFSRFYYLEAPNVKDASPQTLIRASHSVQLESFLDAIETQRNIYSPLGEVVSNELERTLRELGIAPTHDEIEQALLDGKPITTPYQLDRWLFEWEQAHGGIKNPEQNRFEWFMPDNAVLLLLPTTSSWDTLAYLNWYGTSVYGSEYYIALNRSWHQRFGAELVAHYGTMLEYVVSNPPTSPNEAWRLAREHDLAGQCTLILPGVSVRHYAAGLVGCERWFLHERP